MSKVSKIIVMVFIVILMRKTAVFAAPSSNDATKGVDVTVSIEKLDSEIENTLIRVEDNKKEIDKTTTDINSTQKKIAETESYIKENENLFNKRIRAAYINGFSGYINVILDSNGFDDFIWRFENLKNVMEHDKTIINDYQNKKKTMDVEKKNLESKNSSLKTLKEENEKKLVKLREDKQNQKKLLASLSVDKTNPMSIPSRGSASASLSSIISYAYNFLGVPYLWGGTTPSGFDCSGFTQYVFSHFGVGIGRTTFDQIKFGTTVSKDQLKPGDLVFFGTFSNPHHVGIYIGNGSYIHAPHTGDVIKVSPLNRGDFLVAKRVN